MRPQESRNHVKHLSGFVIASPPGEQSDYDSGRIPEPYRAKGARDSRKSSRVRVLGSVPAFERDGGFRLQDRLKNVIDSLMGFCPSGTTIQRLQNAGIKVNVVIKTAHGFDTNQIGLCEPLHMPTNSSGRNSQVFCQPPPTIRWIRAKNLDNPPLCVIVDGHEGTVQSQDSALGGEIITAPTLLDRRNQACFQKFLDVKFDGCSLHVRQALQIGLAGTILVPNKMVNEPALGVIQGG